MSDSYPQISQANQKVEDTKNEDNTARDNSSDKKIKNKQVPARQALGYTIERLRVSLTWIEEVEKELQGKQSANEDGSVPGLRLRILADVIAMYISVLVEKGGSGHSLLKSYNTHEFIKKFTALPVVKKCQISRNNRSGHESKSCCQFISHREILDSDLRDWLNSCETFLACIPENRD